MKKTRKRIGKRIVLINIWDILKKAISAYLSFLLMKNIDVCIALYTHKYTYVHICMYICMYFLNCLVAKKVLYVTCTCKR